MRFATNQPAPKGNLAVHCGGPSSLSSCVYLMGDWTENTGKLYSQNHHFGARQLASAHMASLYSVTLSKKTTTLLDSTR